MTRIAPGSPNVYPMLTPPINPGQVTANANVSLTNNNLLLNASASAGSPFNPMPLQQANPLGINTLMMPPPTNSLITDPNANPFMMPSLYSTSLPPVNNPATSAGKPATSSSTTLPPYMAGNINLNGNNPFLLDGKPPSSQPEKTTLDPKSLISDPNSPPVKQTSEANANGSNATANAININSTVNFSFNPVFMMNPPATTSTPTPTPNPSPAAAVPGNPVVPGPYPNLLPNIQPPVTTPAPPTQNPMAAVAAALNKLSMQPASGMTNTQAAKLLMDHMDELDGAADANQGNKDNVFSINDLLMVGANRGGKYSPQMVQAANQLLNSPEIRIKLSTGPNGIFAIDDLALLAKDTAGNVVPTNYMTTIMQQPYQPYTGTGFEEIPEETVVTTKKKEKEKTKENEKKDPTVTNT